MSKLAVRAEIIKLARLYQVEEDRLSFLQTLQSRGLDELPEIASNAQAQTNGVRSKTKCPGYR